MSEVGCDMACQQLNPSMPLQEKSVGHAIAQDALPKKP
jgi:hypothetical protein